MNSKFLICFKVLICIFFISNQSVASKNQTFTSELVTKNQLVENDSLIFPGISKIILSGINRNDFIDVCAIQWIPITSENKQFSSSEIDLNRQIPYDEFEGVIKNLAKSTIVKASYANLLSADERKIYSLEIGNGLKTVTFTAGIHSREVANPQFLLKFATKLVNDFEKGDDKTIQILSNVRVVILPCINPDGYEGALKGIDAFKNKNIFLSSYSNDQIYTAKSNANGVDINRNFPSYSASLVWENNRMISSHNDDSPSLNYFAGYKLGSENETKVAMSFLMRLIPVSFRYVDFHSAGRIIYAGKPNLSDDFNTLSYKTGKLINLITRYSLLGLNDEGVGLGSDGTITDFAAEIASGFVYNDLLGRLAPPDSIELVRKTEQFSYKCSVNTVETIKTSKREGYGLLRTSTPSMHVKEWEKYNLEKLFYALISE